MDCKARAVEPTQFGLQVIYLQVGGKIFEEIDDLGIVADCIGDDDIISF